MATEKVRPGEIISSDIMNFVLSKLEELESTVNNLGQLNRIRIAQIGPLAGALVGSFIRIEGSNFLHPPGNNIIRIAGVLVTEFGSPSTSGIITCRVPATIDITDEQGEQVVVRVENPEFGVTEATYTLFPESSQPDIVIESVRTEDGATLLRATEPAIITGDNFSPDADANQIQFEWIIAGGENVIYQATEKEVISTTPGEMQIRVTVPDIEEIGAGQSRPVTLTLAFGDRTAHETVLVRGA